MLEARRREWEGEGWGEGAALASRVEGSATTVRRTLSLSGWGREAGEVTLTPLGSVPAEWAAADDFEHSQEQSRPPPAGTELAEIARVDSSRMARGQGT